MPGCRYPRRRWSAVTPPPRTRGGSADGRGSTADPRSILFGGGSAVHLDQKRQSHGGATGGRGRGRTVGRATGGPSYVSVGRKWGRKRVRRCCTTAAPRGVGSWRMRWVCTGASGGGRRDRLTWGVCGEKLRTPLDDRRSDGSRERQDEGSGRPVHGVVPMTPCTGGTAPLLRSYWYHAAAH
jgi:hypothetical protein